MSLETSANATAADRQKHVKRKITGTAIYNQIESQDFCCALTGEALTPETASADHITPLSRGGADLPENLQIITHRANIAKGTMTQAEFIEMCRAVVRVHGLTDGNG